MRTRRPHVIHVVHHQCELFFPNDSSWQIYALKRVSWSLEDTDSIQAINKWRTLTLHIRLCRVVGMPGGNPTMGVLRFSRVIPPSQSRFI